MILAKLMTGKNKEEQTRQSEVDRASERESLACHHFFILLHFLMFALYIYLFGYRKKKRELASERAKKPLDVDGAVVVIAG
jgi:cbb3-type cytochrome oxidase subunit 3